MRDMYDEKAQEIVKALAVGKISGSEAIAQALRESAAEAFGAAAEIARPSLGQHLHQIPNENCPDCYATKTLYDRAALLRKAR